MQIIKTKTTYVEMKSPPPWRIEPPCDDVEIDLVKAPGTNDYLYWYKTVGKNLMWTDRLEMDSKELRTLLDDPCINFYILHIQQQLAGFAEIDRRIDDNVEITYFGLFPDFTGRGLGKYFINAIIHEIWRRPPRRLWLHTCDLDSKAALPNYLKAGFQIFDEKLIDKVIPLSN